MSASTPILDAAGVEVGRRYAHRVFDVLGPVVPDQPGGRGVWRLVPRTVGGNVPIDPPPWPGWNAPIGGRP